MPTSATNQPIRIATWNLNTWLNRKRGVSNSHLWAWAENNLDADIAIFTEAAIPPPPSLRTAGWNFVYRPTGFPNVSGWGTVIGGRRLRLDRVSYLPGMGHELDKQFPGTLTVADLWVEGSRLLTVVGLHLRYRKDQNKRFVGHPTDDLIALSNDLRSVQAERECPLVIAGDLNYPFGTIPRGLAELDIIDAFEGAQIKTFQQPGGKSPAYRMDYMYFSKALESRIRRCWGGIDAFPLSLGYSDHAPLVVELDLCGVHPSPIVNGTS